MVTIGLFWKTSIQLFHGMEEVIVAGKYVTALKQNQFLKLK